MLDPVLELEVLAGARRGGASSACVSAARSSGCTRPSHSPRRVADLGLAVAEHRLPARREVQPVGAHVPVPEAVVGALQRERVALLGLGEPRSARWWVIA